MYWFRFVALAVAYAAGHSATETPQSHLVHGQSSAAVCQQASGAVLLQHRALSSGSHPGQSGGGLLSGLAAQLQEIASSDEHVVHTLLNSNTASYASSNSHSSASTSNAPVSNNTSATTINDSPSQPSAATGEGTSVGGDAGLDAEDLPVLAPPADERPSSEINDHNGTTPNSFNNDPILNSTTTRSRSSAIVSSNASATASKDSSSQPTAAAGEGAGMGEDTGVDASDVPVVELPTDERPSAVIDDHNGTTSEPTANDPIINSSTTRTRSSTTGSTNAPTSNTNSSMTVNITVSNGGHAETRVKRCRNGMCKVHNRTWQTSDGDKEAGMNPTNWTESESNISDILKWLDDAFRAPTVWNEGILDDPRPFSGGAGGFVPVRAEWHGWDDMEPDSNLPDHLNAFSASLSEGFLKPWLKGSKVGLSGHLPWGLRSHDLVVDQSGRDVIVAYHLGNPEKLDIRQVVAFTQVPLGEPLQTYDDASGSFELWWPCGYED